MSSNVDFNKDNYQLLGNGSKLPQSQTVTVSGENDNGDLISFTIRDGTDKSIAITMSRNSTILQLKQKLQSMKHIESRIILTFSGMTLKDNMTLKYYKITNNSGLDYTLNLDGGIRYYIINILLIKPFV